MSDEDRERWDARYRGGGHGSTEPSRVLVALDALIPRTGRALDVAGGAGRNALWLAGRGLDVTIADVSSVGLAMARERAAERGLTIETVEADLESGALPPGPWDLVLSVLYSPRAILAPAAATLAPGGTLVIIQPTKTNLERHARPPERFLLDDGELAAIAPALEILRSDEGWFEDERHDAVLVARRPT